MQSLKLKENRLNLPRNNIFAVYKPPGPTSHDIINQLRRLTGVRRIGHAGTLDPLASGVLVVGIGRQATRKLKRIVGQEKEYLAIIRLGSESTTDDAAGKKTRVALTNHSSLDEVKTALKKFQGHILQTPPAYSAIKVKGQEAYKLAYQGKTFTLKPRRVEIKDIRLLGYKWPRLKLRVITGPGVYIRALARDIGRKLKTGGFLEKLERQRVGSYSLKQAFHLGFSAPNQERLNR